MKKDFWNELGDLYLKANEIGERRVGKECRL